MLYAARLIALFPLGHDVTAANSTGDDWLIYHQNALSVLNGGLTMPIVDGAYVRPAGLGYVYFIASIYAVAGVRSEAVYLVQGLLLIAGIIGMYAVFRPRLSSLTSLAFLVALTVFMYVDMYRALTFRLLSENLLFPLLPALLFCVIKGEATAKLRYFAIGGVVCGLCFLVRPNSLLLGPAAAVVILFFRSPRSFSWRTQAALVLLAACAAVVSLLPLRNYAVTGQATVASVTNPSDWSGSRYRGQILPLSERLQGRLRRSARRVAYLVGMPQFMRPAFRFRPHWLAMWGAFIWYLYTLIQRKGQFWEVLVVAVAVSYFAPLMEFGDIASYGSRMLVPGLPLILVLAIRGLDGSSLLPSLRSRPT
ncbi:MAG: glycosyltransferase family 39 protein [Vicinamibacterales bacterium]